MVTSSNHQRFIHRLIIVLLCGLILAGGKPVLAADKTPPLSTVIDRVTRSFPTVKRLTADQFKKLNTDAALPPILFDVRNQNEYNVSHLPGAINLSPETNTQEFLKEYGGLIRLTPQRKIVFICYVGYSSFAMADKVAKDFSDLAPRIYGLDGGIFDWHNKKLPLIDATGPTDAIHPHDFMWRGFLSRQEKILYEPHPKTTP